MKRIKATHSHRSLNFWGQLAAANSYGCRSLSNRPENVLQRAERGSGSKIGKTKARSLFKICKISMQVNWECGRRNDRWRLFTPLNDQSDKSALIRVFAHFTL